MRAEDTYNTITGYTEGYLREKGSKFHSYAWHVETEEEIKEIVDEMRKKFYDATQRCYAWRLGPKGEKFRANDDGEPSGTAGKPILGQLLSRDLTYTMVMVVRYFGGTKLGVPGLIAAYKDSAAEVLDNCNIVMKTENAVYDINFGYLVMNDIMKVIKEFSPEIIEQAFDNECLMSVSIRKSLEEQMVLKFKDIEGINIEFKGYK
ncbi:MAG: YigZ family protein [Rikenellaceae bacterium]|nr:YigZ family protein [Rikenellaceae bacterium]